MSILLPTGAYSIRHSTPVSAREKPLVYTAILPIHWSIKADLGRDFLAKRNG